MDFKMRPNSSKAAQIQYSPPVFFKYFVKMSGYI